MTLATRAFNALPDLAANPLAEWAQRLDSVEVLGAQLTEAVGSVVDAVVGLQERFNSPIDEDATGMTALLKRVAALEQQTRLQAACQDLTRTSGFHPKVRSVVFVATTYFGCNIKYAWLAFRTRAQAAGVQAWFLPQTLDQEQAVNSLGEACFPVDPAQWQTHHIQAALSAAVVVTCDHFLNPNPYAAALLAGARHVQLWHGISIKEIGLRNIPPLKHMSTQIARVMATCGPFTRLIGTSAAQESEFRRWFGFERYAPIGYPRNDVLLREPDAADLLNVDRAVLQQAREARQAGRRVWLYAPTFRDAQRGSWIVQAGLEQLARTVHQQGDLLIVNMHPVESPMIPQLRDALPTAHFVTPRTDIYPLLREASALITDYSSVMFDFLLLDQPIVLFRPDHADYTTRSRQLFDAKLDALPGALCTDVQGLLAVLGQHDLQADEFAPVRAKLREQLFDQPDGRSGERLADLLFEELDLALPAATGN
jgi:CDP-glycerol glycerophosphotransferase